MVVLDNHLKVDELWTTILKSKVSSKRWIQIHDSVGHWVKDQKQSLFSAFTGCDTVSAFVGKDKTQHGKNVFENVEEVFRFISFPYDN